MSTGRLQFVPRRVRGIQGVTAVAVYPDRLELETADGVITHWFKDISRWPTPPIVWKFLYRFGVKPRWLPVAARCWSIEPADRYFSFYTKPRIKIYMPMDEIKDYEASYFYRIVRVICEREFHTDDMN